jgi:hypothetical protein
MQLITQLFDPFITEAHLSSPEGNQMREGV